MTDDIGQRQPRVRDPGYLAFLRKLPCCACNAAAPSEAAHLRIGSRKHNKRATGMQEKPDDAWATPLCAGCHRTDKESQHNIGERKFWDLEGIVTPSPFDIARQLYHRYLAEGGPGPVKQRARKATKPRKPPASRAKIAQRPNPWPKGRGFGR